LWKAEEEISDLVDIETVPSPLRRLLKEAESDSTEAEDDESSNDENIDEDDEEDEDGTEDNNGFMQKRAVQVSGAAGVGLAVGGSLAYWLKKGAPVKTPQVGRIAVEITADGNIPVPAVAALNSDSNVLSTVEETSKRIYTLYDTFPNFQKKHSAVPNASENKDPYAVYALQGFEDAELKKFKAIGTATKDGVILTQAELRNQLGQITDLGEVHFDGFNVKFDMQHMIITKDEAPPPAASAAPAGPA